VWYAGLCDLVKAWTYYKLEDGAADYPETLYLSTNTQQVVPYYQPTKPNILIQLSPAYQHRRTNIPHQVFSIYQPTTRNNAQNFFLSTNPQGVIFPQKCVPTYQ
jgi:hypothetical protein